MPRELAIEELPGIIADFAQATRNARAAGFDGVELHGANGYLHDQFLQDGSNKRTDAYGGSVENRARLMIETAQAMINAWDAEHVGVRLSPSSYLYGVDDSDKRATFGTVIDQLNALGIAYLVLLEPNAKDLQKGVQIEHVAETFRSRITVPLIVNSGFDKAKGNAVIARGEADAVAFGVLFIANPDLVERLRHDAPFNKPDPSTFYGEGAKGYTDYPEHRRGGTGITAIMKEAAAAPRALVLGATGGIGGETAAALLRHGWQVVAMVRDPAKAKRKTAGPLADATFVAGDAMNASDVARAAQGARVIVHAVNPPGLSKLG